MISKLISAATVALASIAWLAIAWFTWPSKEMIAPEETGEIGFLGIVVVTKYIGYILRAAASILLASVSFSAVLTLSIIAVDAVANRADRLS
ncbi:hypothetical protein [Allorhodopirellula solitaria]|uniref:Uncharacterized protein n=1 Tax=Allorhodopirellula solitaria TaxID=2527987 RepID=A0A5C5XAG7_9BACT|nr:hypothetical protein [Allorhodopirellula solitaria]TWT59293.1 hypothetical protein CA85_39890 [Allorhodopirellula solitaria]